jgi:hypothetical protein
VNPILKTKSEYQLSMKAGTRGGGNDRDRSGRSVAAEDTFPDGDAEAASPDSLSPVIGWPP